MPSGLVPPGPFEAALRVRRRNRWLLAGYFVLLALVTLRAPGFFLPGFFVGLFFLQKNPLPSVGEETVQVDTDVLRIGTRTIPRAKIRNAQIVPLRTGSLAVRVWTKGTLPLDLVVRDKPQGRSLLRALGFDASQTVTHFRGASHVMAHWAFRSGLVFLGIPLLFMGLMLILPSSPALFAAGAKAVFVAMLAAALAMVLPSRIVVGADGVLTTWLGSRRFHPLAEIRRVERYDDGIGGKNRSVGVLLTMNDGSLARLPVGSAQWGDETASALIERIHEAIETRAVGQVDGAAMLLGREAREVSAWVNALRAIGAGANADLRTAAVSHAQLWRVVESHGAQAADRAAAAVALAPSLDAEGKQRLRVAVDAVADVRLRAAIEAVEANDDAALEAALAEVSAEERKALE